MQEIGFSLYTELLGRAVESLKAGREPDLEGPLDAGVDINLHIPALLPEDYMVDVGVNLTWRFHPRWELTGGYQFYARDISTSELTNKIDYNVPFAAFTHLW